MPVTLYDPKTGVPKTLSVEEAQKAVSEKALGPQVNQRVHVVLEDGSKGTVLGSDLHETLASGGKLYDPEAEKHAAEVEAENTGTGFVGAASLSGLEGITGGLSTGLIRKGISHFSPEAGKNFEHDVAINREAWPKTHLVGNVAGATGAALASGGIGGVARLAPTAGIDALGAMAERGVGRALAGVGGEGLAGTTVRGAAKMAARAGTENALFSAGTHVGEDMLGDHDTAGDKLFVATAKGGAYGLGLGAVLGGAGSLVRSTRGAASKGGGAILGDAAEEGLIAAETKLRAAETAHADATKRSFSYKDFQGAPVEGDLYKAGPGGLDDFTTPMESEQAFDLKKQRQINLGPSEGDAAYKNPHTVDAIHDTYDKSGQLVVPKAPKGEKAFDIGSMQRQVDPMSMGTRFQDPSYWEGPLKFDKDAVALKMQPTGIDGLKPTPAGSPMHISSDKGVVSVNEKLRRGSIGEAYSPQTNSDAAFSTADGTREASPFGIGEQIEDPIVTARREAAHAELKTAQKDFAQAAKESEEATHLAALANEVRSGDPHGMAADFAWQSTGANKGLTTKVNRFPGGTRRAGETMLRLGIVDVAEGQGAVKATMGSLSENTPEKMLERTQTKLRGLVDELHAIGGTNTSVTLKKVLAPLDEQIAKFEKVSGTVPVANRLRATRQALLGTPKLRGLLDVDGNLIPGALEHPVSLADLIAERQSMQRQAFEVGNPHANYFKESNAEISRAWGSLEGEALDQASHLGGSNGAQFKAVKTDVTDLINVEKALEGRINGMSSGRSVGLLDHLVGHGAAMAGGAVLPFGGHLVGGAVGALLSKSIRERGNAAAAVALTKIADIGAVKHLMGTVDSAVERAAKGLTSTVEKDAPKVRVVGGSASGKPEGKRAPLATRYRDAIGKLEAMENAASPVHERAMQSTQDLAQHAPNVANAFALSMSRAAAFLSSKRPQPLMPADPYTAREPSILDSDKLAYLRSYEAATNPMGVLQRFEKGVITPEDTEALKATAPKVYEQLQQKVMAEVAARRAAGKPMPFKRRMELGLLFDQATDPSLEPQTYRMLQSNVFTPPAAPPKPKGGKTSGRHSVKLPSALDGYFDGPKAGRR